MLREIKNSALWRALFLALFLISVLGLWAFDLFNVPAQYPYTPPNVRLNGDFCGSPVSGWGAFRLAAGGLFSKLSRLINEKMPVPISGFMMALSRSFIVLPFVSITLLIWKPNSRRLRILNLIMCPAACLSAAVVFFSQTSRDEIVHLACLLWGGWLYLLTVTGVMIYEFSGLRCKPCPGLK